MGNEYLTFNKCDLLYLDFYSIHTNNIDETMLEDALAYGTFSHKDAEVKLVTAADLDGEVEKFGLLDDIKGYRLYKYIKTVDISYDNVKDIYLIITYYLNTK